MNIYFLRKKELISPKELELQWLPLFNLCESFMYKETHSSNLYKYTTNYIDTLEKVVKSTKIYFPVSVFILCGYLEFFNQFFNKAIYSITLKYY